MKKAIAILLALTLCLGLAACGGTGSEDHDYILHLLETGQYDMAIHVIEGLRDGGAAAPPQEQPESTAPRPDSGTGDPYNQQYDLPPEFTGSDWLFHMTAENLLQEDISLEALVIIDFMDGNQTGFVDFVYEELAGIGLENVVLAPGQSIRWDDAHPAVTHFNQRLYQFIFRDGAGTQVSINYYFHMEDMLPSDNPTSGEPPAGDWYFPIVLENTGSGPLTLFAMDITNILNGQPMGTHIFQDEESLTRIGLAGLVLEPGDTLTWNDAHPAVSDWNAREYRFHFRDDQGSQVSLEFLFEELDRQNEPTDYSQDQGQQLRTLRPDAAFQVEVYPGVYWVPAATLGGSRYSNAQIHTMLDLSPEEKQQQISTLYEALQLFQVGGFYASDDNVRIYENGINWEHHKPGYHAVRTNTGCCATDSNWLRYILDGDYQEVGFISTSQRDGSGHIFNYILQEGSYYIIDLTHHRANDAPFLTAEENGDLNAYRATDYILGNIHMVQDIQAFVDYVQQDFSDPPGMMFMHAAENALPLDSLPADGKVQIVYSTQDKDILRVIFDDPSDALELGWADGPSSFPDWNTLP